MTRSSRRFLLLVVALALAGCGSPPAPTASSPPASPAPTIGRTSVPSASPAPSGTIGRIDDLKARITANPADAEAQRALGFALAQRVRETADPSLYAPAEAAFEAALKVDPEDALALVGVAGIQLGKHRFADGLATAEKALTLSPRLVPAHAAKVDALVELGRYDEADDAGAVMFGLSSDLSTLSRISYLAELRGEITAALLAMQLATEAPGEAPENSAFVESLYGNLLVYSGDPVGAAAAYDRALALVPDHPPTLAGQARLAVGAGKLDEAITLFQRASTIVPLPEYVIALGDAQEAAGKSADAQRSYDLASAEIRLFESAGVVVDVDLALFEADHGDPASALEHARAAYRETPTIRAADAVAWALHRLGRDEDARAFVVKALHLGTIDPLIRYHAGAVEAALGQTTAAKRDLQLAIDTDPGFSATGVAEARRILATLD